VDDGSECLVNVRVKLETNFELTFGESGKAFNVDHVLFNFDPFPLLFPFVEDSALDAVAEYSWLVNFIFDPVECELDGFKMFKKALAFLYYASSEAEVGSVVEGLGIPSPMGVTHIVGDVVEAVELFIGIQLFLVD
jgi:hypothetical protein